MNDSRSVQIELPAWLVAKVQRLASACNVDVSALIARAVRMYVKEERSREVREELERGYREMADLNLSLAQESLVLDPEGWEQTPDTPDGGS